MLPPNILLTPSSFRTSAESLQTLEPSSVVYRSGARNVLVTSTHGFDHIREGVNKSADNGSREFSHLLATSCDSHWLAVNQANEPDGNHHRDTPFKESLGDALAANDIQLVIDIHGSHCLRPFDVDVGTLHQRSWLGKNSFREALFRNLAASGFLVTDNQVFSGKGSTPSAETVVRYCLERGVPSVQLEISSAFMAELDSRMALHQHAKLANALANFISQVRR